MQTGANIPNGKNPPLETSLETREGSFVLKSYEGYRVEKHFGNKKCYFISRQLGLIASVGLVLAQHYIPTPFSALSILPNT